MAAPKNDMLISKVKFKENLLTPTFFLTKQTVFRIPSNIDDGAFSC